MTRQHQGTLHRFGHHLGGPGLAQHIEIALIRGAHNHRHLGRVFAHMGQHLECRGRIVVTHHHRGSARQARRHQAGQTRSISKHHTVPRGGGLTNPVRVKVQRHVGDVLLTQQTRQLLSTASIATDDHM